MADPSTNDVRVSFEVEGLQQKLKVLDVSGDEGLSQLYTFDLSLACASDKIAFADVIGKPGLLTITGEHGPRYVHGIVSQLQQRETGTYFTVYHLVLVPQMWRLLHRRDCRIFQDKTVTDVVTEVFKEAGLPDDAVSFKWDKGKDKTKRDYIVQYRENDWAFTSRLLEEHGCFYFFEHSQTRHELIIGNTFQAHPEVAGEVEVPFHRAEGLLPSTEHITRFFFREVITPERVTLGDYNPLKPKLSLESQTAPPKKGDLEVYDYPGEYKLPEEGGSLAGLRLEQARALREVGEGSSDCVRFISGSHFKLVGHTRADLNDKQYVLTRVIHGCEGVKEMHSMTAEQRVRYYNEFECAPRTTPFRPAHITPKPTTHGVQTAQVVGPAGEEIYTDTHGRVKGQFYWDRLGKLDENSSCWVRVSQAWASQGWGAMFLPRIGDEVVVDFIEGDPDRPIITGRVYHAQNVPPYGLPDNKTRSTIKSNSSPGGGGSNEIRFEDKKGSEEIYTHAQKDQNEVIENNMTTSVGANQTITVGADRTKTVKGNETNTIKGNQVSTVEKFRSLEVGKDQTTLIKGSRAQMIENDDMLWVVKAREHIVQGDEEVSVEGKQTVHVTKGQTVNVTDGQNINVTDGRSLDVKGDSSVEVSVDRSVIVHGDSTLGAMGNLNMLCNKNMEIGGKEVMITATKKLTIGVGSSSITIDAKGVSIAGPKITSAAVGIHEISGALIKIN